jgi:hypothetical protein
MKVRPEKYRHIVVTDQVKKLCKLAIKKTIRPDTASVDLTFRCCAHLFIFLKNTGLS